jgi:DNA ligase-associated metallophosphoesterase
LLRLGGLEIELDLSGAAFIRDYSALLVADLHFEKGSNLAARGQPIPPFDSRATLAALEHVMARYQPQRLIALGDSFHDSHAGRRVEAADLARICRLSDLAEIVWITGNHDAKLPPHLAGRTASEVALGPLRLRHVPSPDLADSTEIAGHLHPVATISQRGHRVTARCFAASRRRLIMPAFGSYTGGLNVRMPAIAGLFGGESFDAWLIGRTGIFCVDGRSLS